MKNFSLTFSLCAISFASAVADVEPYVVQATVVETNKVPPIPPPPGVPIERLNDAPFVWVAVLTIDKVFSGPKTIVGGKIQVTTADQIPLGNARVTTPRLNLGDVGIFAIKRDAKGNFMDVYTPPIINEGQLPLIKGRDAGYELALVRLSSTTAENAISSISKQTEPASTSLNRQTENDLSGKSALSKLDSGLQDSVHSVFGTTLWLAGGVVAVLALAIIVLLKCHSKR